MLAMYINLVQFEYNIIISIAIYDELYKNKTQVTADNNADLK